MIANGRRQRIPLPFAVCAVAVALTPWPVMPTSFPKNVGSGIGLDADQIVTPNLSLNTTDIVVRYTWSGITTPTPRWEQAFSEDGGETWETNFVSEFTRADDE